MKIQIQTRKSKYYINFNKILRNIIIIVFIIISIKYIKYMNNYNKKMLATYQDYSIQCKNANIKVCQEDYKAYIKTLNK